MRNISRLIILFFNNFIYIPIIFYDILKKKENIFFIALFLGIFGFFFQPSEDFDLMRYYELFNFSQEIRNIFFSYQRDYYAKYLVELLIYFKLPKELLAFSSAFISYYFFFKSLNIILYKKNYSSKMRLGIYLCFYACIPIIDYTGIRSLPSIALMSYSIILKYIKHTKKYIIFGLLACLFHSSMLIIFLGLLLIEKVLRKKMLKIILITTLIVGVSINENTILKLTQAINSLNIIYISPNYILGEWGINYINKFNLIGKVIKSYIILNLKKVIVIYFVFIILKTKDRIARIFTVLISIYFLFINYQTISSRYFKLILVLIYFYIIKKEENFQKIKYKILFLLILIYSLIILLLDLKQYSLNFILSYVDVYKISFSNILYKIFIGR